MSSIAVVSDRRTAGLLINRRPHPGGGTHSCRLDSALTAERARGNIRHVRLSGKGDDMIARKSYTMGFVPGWRASFGRSRQEGKVGWILLWLVGIPIPVLIVLFLIRGCT